MNGQFTRIYLFIGLGLLLLLGLTVGIAFVDLGPFNTVVSLTIALLKAILILLFFMHVLYERALLWLFVGAGFFWLGIMLMLGLSDYLTRGWR